MMIFENRNRECSLQEAAFRIQVQIQIEAKTGELCCRNLSYPKRENV